MSNFIEATPAVLTRSLASATATALSASDLWVAWFSLAAPAATGTVTWGDATAQKNPLNHFFPSLDLKGRVRYNLRNIYVKTDHAGGDDVEVAYIVLPAHY